MRYRNVKTGAVIEIASELKGEDWEAIKPAPVKDAPKPAPKKGKTKK
jgi:hypothetical protein